MEQNTGSNVIINRHWAMTPIFFSPFMTWAVHLVLLKAQFQQMWRQALSLTRWGRHNGNCTKDTEVPIQFFPFLKLSQGYFILKKKEKKKKAYPPFLTAVCGKGSHYLSQSCHCASGTFRVLPMLLCLISGLWWPLGRSSALRCLTQGRCRACTRETQKVLRSHQQALCPFRCPQSFTSKALRGSV